MVQKVSRRVLHGWARGPAGGELGVSLVPGRGKQRDGEGGTEQMTLLQLPPAERREMQVPEA